MHTYLNLRHKGNFTPPDGTSLGDDLQVHPRNRQPGPSYLREIHDIIVATVFDLLAKFQLFRTDWVGFRKHERHFSSEQLNLKK